jgi:mRNA-degrading endonuclease RelE of RelBE toxin-antitoxin system
MTINFTRKAEKQFSKLPKYLKKKAKKQFHFLLDDYYHPSLRTKRMMGQNKFEARIDRRYRFTFQIIDSDLFVLSIGPHDEGLGKK